MHNTGNAGDQMGQYKGYEHQNHKHTNKGSTCNVKHWSGSKTLWNTNNETQIQENE